MVVEGIRITDLLHPVLNWVCDLLKLREGRSLGTLLGEVLFLPGSGSRPAGRRPVRGEERCTVQVGGAGESKPPGDGGVWPLGPMEDRQT